jgi:hypothetical protein
VHRIIDSMQRKSSRVVYTLMLNVLFNLCTGINTLRVALHKRIKKESILVNIFTRLGASFELVCSFYPVNIMKLKSIYMIMYMPTKVL